MNTEQKYVGKEDSTTPTPETAQNAAQTTPSSDDWRVEFLQDCLKNRNDLDDLFKVVEHVRLEMDCWNPVPGLAQLLGFYLSNRTPGVENVGKANLSSVLRLIAFMTDLREHYNCLDIGTRYDDLARINYYGNTDGSIGGTSHE